MRGGWCGLARTDALIGLANIALRLDASSIVEKIGQGRGTSSLPKMIHKMRCKDSSS